MRFLILILILAVAPMALALDYLGTSVQMGWTQPEGSTPDGWRVYVSRNGADAVQEQEVSEVLATLAGVADETITVSVSAYLADHETELSEASDPVTFRVLSKPSGVAIFCEGSLVEITPGWWTCQ